MSFFDGFHDLPSGQNCIDPAKVERLGFVFSIKSFFFAASKQGAFILCYTEARVARTNMRCSCEGNLSKKSIVQLIFLDESPRFLIRIVSL